ncbi:transposase [Bacillus fonticola]|uniref:transposase n=1 Tax=Bacillus fonticola TaxID=2728853 RepID=UPI00147480C1|nr:transposase [Bacillus fonticola]
MASYIGLLSQGRSDFDDIERYRADEAFSLSMGIDQVPSSPTFRQRLDALALKYQPHAFIPNENAKLLSRMKGHLTPIQVSDNTHCVPIDIDVSPWDNGKTQKEGVSRTYKGCDGFSPIFSYVGREGYCLHTEPRKGSQHVQKGTPAFIRDTLQLAAIATSQKLLVRLDGGIDSADTVQAIQEAEVPADMILKLIDEKNRKKVYSRWRNNRVDVTLPVKENTCTHGERENVYKVCQPVLKSTGLRTVKSKQTDKRYSSRRLRWSYMRLHSPTR